MREIEQRVASAGKVTFVTIPKQITELKNANVQFNIGPQNKSLFQV